MPVLHVALAQTGRVFNEKRCAQTQPALNRDVAIHATGDGARDPETDAKATIGGIIRLRLLETGENAFVVFRRDTGSAVTHVNANAWAAGRIHTLQPDIDWRARLLSSVLEAS